MSNKSIDTSQENDNQDPTMNDGSIENMPENDADGSPFVDGENGMPVFIDAGFGPEMDQTQIETKRAVLRIIEGKAEGDAKVAAIRLGEPDIVKRARALAGIGAVSFPDVKWMKSGDQPFEQPLPTDGNRWAVFDVLFGEVGSERRPHIDSWRAQAIDHNGREINGTYEPVTLVRALQAAGLKGQDGEKVMKAFKSWILLDVRNTLADTVRSKLPQWDGRPRMETWLTKLFESKADGLYEINGAFSKYFALSLYGRVMHPGCYAPIIMAIIGAQNCGKSHFGNIISEWMTDIRGREVAEWDLGTDKNSNLRTVTGVSPIVYFPELGGLPNSDIKKFRQIATTTSDRMDYKYQDTQTQKRQYVFVLDSNKYESIHRDSDGNRRIHVMFAGQTDDVNGKPAWKPQPWKIDYTGFEDEFWQVMAEAADFWEHFGETGYRKFVDTVVPMVADHNAKEVRRDSGTMTDELLDYVLPKVLPDCEKRIRSVTFDDGKKKIRRKCLAIEVNAIREAAGRRRDTNLEKVSTQRISLKMTALGAIVLSDKTTRYIFQKFCDENTYEFDAHVAYFYGSGTGIADDGSGISIDGGDTEACPPFMLEDVIVD